MKARKLIALLLSILMVFSLLAGCNSDGGAQGPQGEKGDKGDQGIQGETGATIEKVEYNDQGQMVITMTDGTVHVVDVPEKEHTYGAWTSFKADPEDTCEERVFYRICADCGNVEWKMGSYGDHSWNTVTTPPTCQAGGYDTKTCTLCGKVEIGNETEITDHTYGTEYLNDNSYHWFKCVNCDATKDKTEHTLDTDGICTVCDALVGATEGVLYDLSADGTYAEVIGYTGSATRVRIAEEYKGVPVKRIYEKAFYNNINIVSVMIPAGVTSIGDDAFRVCYSLTSVTFGENSQLTSIGPYAFAYCSRLTSIEIPASVTSIGEWAFCDCDSLTSVTFGENSQLTSIGPYAFAYCSRLTSMEIPASVTSISSAAFRGCSSLTSVTFVNPNGWWYSSSSTATSGTAISSSDLANASTAATRLTSTYFSYYWKRG